MDFQIRIISTSASRIPCGPSSFIDIVRESGSSEEIVFNSNSSTYLLLLNESKTSSADWTTADATRFFEDSIQASRTSAVCLFTDFQEDFLHSPGREGSTQRNYVLCLLELSDPASASFQNWPRETFSELPIPRPSIFSFLTRLRVKQTFSNGKHKSSRWTTFAASLAILAAIFGTALFLVSFRSRSSEIWQRYDVRGSSGPRYQLQFNHRNVSSWEERFPSPNEKWFLRIDDQALVPHALVDEEELRYQQWFQTRYPEANEIRLRGDYLKETFLSDPSSIQVPADKEFHMAHCVLALRRYWTAKETGHHVCPRDIDFKHIRHCLDALDMWAFPEGPRRSLPSATLDAHAHSSSGNSVRRQHKGVDGFLVDESDTTRLVWRTKVCFDG